MAITKGRKNKQAVTSRSAVPRRAKTRIHFKNSIKKYNRKSTRRSRKRVVKTVPVVIKQPTLPLNIDFYNVVDGVYTSY